MQAKLASKIWIQNKANNEATMNKKAKVNYFFFLFLTETNLWLSLRLVKTLNALWKICFRERCQKFSCSKVYLWNAGSMDPDRTTTIGDSDPVTTIRPFQIINADETIIPNDRTWKMDVVYFLLKACKYLCGMS